MGASRVLMTRMAFSTVATPRPQLSSSACSTVSPTRGKERAKHSEDPYRLPQETYFTQIAPICSPLLSD